MFKILSLTLAALLCAVSMSAQAVSTIQVTVSDTIQVSATHIYVAVSFKDTAQATFQMDFEVPSESETSDTPPAPAQPDFSKSYQQVLSILKKEGITWKKPEEQLGFLGSLGNAMKSDTISKGFTVDFTSKAQMDRVLPRIKAVTFADTKEMGVAVDKDLVDKKRLYAKLLTKSRTKAEEIAKLADKKVGSIHQIGSAFDAFSPDKYMESMMGGGMMGGLMKMMGSMFNEKTPDYKVTVSENMTIIYYLQ